ncbi:MAG: YcxB family protein [Kangiellaceae bacterium]|nr:YcxB family protein [Kangiellaceae bacterium]
MEVTTELTRWDLVKFNLTILPRMRSTYITGLIIAVVLFFIVVGEKGAPETMQNWLASIAGVLIAGLFASIVSIFISLIPILITSRIGNGILGKHDYKLTPDGLYEETIANNGLTKWEGISDIKTTNSFILIRISGYLFHVIPRRSFSSSKAFNSFSASASSYWESANSLIVSTHED